MTVDELTERVARAVQESWSASNGFCGEEVCPVDRGSPCTCAMESTTAALTAIGIPLSVLATLATWVALRD
jgi:hypothetical protein